MPRIVLIIFGVAILVALAAAMLVTLPSQSDTSASAGPRKSDQSEAAQAATRAMTFTRRRDPNP